MDKVRCNWCTEVFDEDKIIDDGETEFCPFCNHGGCLMDMEKVFASFNRFEIELFMHDAEKGSHSGDCESDVIELMNEPYIKEQLDKIDPVALKTELRDYGTWDDEELSNHEDNKMRVLWIACGDIVEEKSQS